MNSEFTEVLKAFLEVGMLGLCAIMMIIIFYENHKRSNETDDNKNKFFAEQFNKLNEKMDTAYNKMQSQNDRFMELQEQHFADQRIQNATLVDAIIHGITNHVPSVEETDKLTRINKKIDIALKQIRQEAGANRACLVQYHNGGKGLNHQAFLKMSMTNEDVATGTSPMMGEFKDQFRSSLGYFVNNINETKACYIDDLNDIRSKDIGVYEFMKLRNVSELYGYAIKGNQNNVIAFIALEFIDNQKADKVIVEKVFKESHRIFETLLNE